MKMRTRRVLSLLCSFGLVTAPLGPALIETVLADSPATGTVETDRGLHTANFDTLYGTVTVSLPDDLSAGDSISGTVETKPAGKKTEDVARNQDELSGVVIEMAESKTPAKLETTHMRVPDDAPATIPVVVKDKAGKEIGRAFLPVKPKVTGLGCSNAAADSVPASAKSKATGAEGPPPAESSGPNTIRGSLTHATVSTSPAPCPVELPTFTQPGRTMEVKGPFDGNSGTTTVNVGGQPARVLAESPRKAVIKTPPNLKGSTVVEIFKKGQPLARAEVRSVAVKLWAGKLTLARGETTKFTATVDGLDGLDVPVSLRIDNKSPAVVSMEGGNLQTFSIAPGQVTQGQFVIARVLTGIQPGGFGIVAVVEAKLRPFPPAGQEPPQAGVPPDFIRPASGQPVAPQRAGQPAVAGESPRAPRLPEGVGLTARNPAPPSCSGTFDDFESGVLAWQTSGTSFQNQPVQGDVNIADARPPGFSRESLRAIGGDYWDTPFPNGHQGQFWIWSKYAGEAATGGMISPEFTLATRYVDFLVGGGNDSRVFAALEIEEESVPVAPGQGQLPAGVLPPRPPGQPATTNWHTLNTARGQGSDMLQRVVFEIPSQSIGRRARFKVEDWSATSHIAVDDFRCSNERPPTPPTPPVWGIADTHLHQFTNIGFGGHYIQGSTFDHTASRPCDSTNLADLVDGADCAMAKALQRCDRYHGPGGTLDILGEFGPGHATMGYPRFDGWPKWSSTDHQRVYSDWLKRAHQAGLQLIVIQLTSAEPICVGLGLGHESPTCRDMDSVDLQIAEAQAFERYIAATDGGWYKLVKTPLEARQAIAQGKLAALLGIEVDTLFDCPALDDPVSPREAELAAARGIGAPPAGPHPNWLFETNRPVAALGLPARLECTPEQVTRKLEHYVNDLGVRHFYPIHLIDNQFGGAAIYNEFFQVANLSVNGSFFHRDPNPAVCASDVAFSFRINHIPAAERVLLREIKGYDFDPNSPPPGPHCNERGLTPLGEHLIREMMRLKVFIDVDHMSEKAFKRMVELANGPGGPYPLLSGHAGFRALGYTIEEAVAQIGPEEAVGMVRHESMKSAAMVEAIRQTGGIVGPIVEPGNNRRFVSPSNQVINDCPGSSKSWAQNYLYAVDAMHGRGLGWGSEMMGLTKLPGPRFGGEACKAVDQSDAVLLGLGPYQMFTRDALAARQWNPPARPPGPTRVSYRAPQVARCDDSGFGRDRLGFIQQGLCKARTVTGSSWGDINQQCLADVSPCLATESGLLGEACLRNNVCRGVRRGMDPHIDCAERLPFGEIGSGEDNRTGACRAQQGLPCNTGNRNIDKVCEEVHAELQSQREPTALVPVVAGTKVFDINTDGFAHVGMVPDFLADLETVGVTKPQFVPLFRSAEDFIEAWEKIEGTRLRGPWPAE